MTRWSWLLVALSIASLCAGCRPQTGNVSGKVVYRGQPLPGGFVTFRPDDPNTNSVSYALEADGKFVVELPVGPVKVCVDNREFEPLPPTLPPSLPNVNLPAEVKQAMSQPQQVSERWVKIPAKYYELESTDLSFEVVGGNQQQTLELRD
jgi:hypothetical protein